MFHKDIISYVLSVYEVQIKMYLFFLSKSPPLKTVYTFANI